jgi:hypothetical protein
LRDLKITPGVIPNCAEIVELAIKYADRFRDYPDPSAVRRRGPDWDPFNPYRDSEYEDDDQYHVLQGPDMPDDLRAAILRGIAPNGLKLKNFYVQINRYDVGDYVLPHRDTMQQGLYMLTSSERNSLVVQDAAGRPVRIPDRAGTFITFDPNAWHWVDPVVDHERFTMVTIPALPHP